MPDVLAIDPGTRESALVRWDGSRIKEAIIWPNADVLCVMRQIEPLTTCAIESMVSYGLHVGDETFTTCVWIGRFYEAYAARCKREPQLIKRPDIKLHHCGARQATDANIREALIAKYGHPGKKSSPGITYGLKSHLWSAFAIATYVTETQATKAA